MSLREWNVRCAESEGKAVTWRTWNVREAFIHSCPDDAYLLRPACTGVGATVEKKKDLTLLEFPV